MTARRWLVLIVAALTGTGTVVLGAAGGLALTLAAAFNGGMWAGAMVVAFIVQDADREAAESKRERGE